MLDLRIALFFAQILIFHRSGRIYIGIDAELVVAAKIPVRLQSTHDPDAPLTIFVIYLYKLWC